MLQSILPRLAAFATLGTLGVLLVTGCEDSGPNAAGGGPLAIIVVSPNPDAVTAGATRQFVAAGEDANGNSVVLNPAPTWAIGAGGGTIDTVTGLFTAGGAAGTFANTVQATSGGITGFASVLVTSGGLATISVTPDPVTVASGTDVQFVATGRDAANNIVPLSTTWSVTNVVAGTIDSVTGVFTASATPGTYPNTIVATSGAIADSASVTVVASGGALATIVINPNPGTMAATGTRQFTATGQDINGVVVPISPAVTWTVVNGGGGINGVSGLFTAGATSGSFSNTVRATSGAVSGFASVTITPPAQVGPSLGTAGAFAVLGSTAVSCIGVSNIAGDVGVAPAGSVSGFPAPCTIAAPGAPTPHINDAVAQRAQQDVTPAFNALAAMPCGTSLTGQDLGGKTLSPGVYCFTSAAQLTGTLTLAGPSGGLWVFQISSALTTGTSAHVVMSGGGLAKNVFWQVGSSATIGQTTTFQGNIVAGVSVTLVQGASLNGRALSKAGVTMDTNIITLP
ncbi:MAG: ice-binding family protein [Gemmatimonadota bacterium]